jgi:lysophospholipase L1-like esterase
MSTNRLLTAMATTIVLIAVIVVFVRSNAPGSAATTTSSSTSLTSKTTVLYLDVGASVSVGVQPTPRDPRGQPTNRGYSNRLVTIEAAKGVTLKLTELGCPGESIATMLHGPDPCYVAPDTQLSDSIAFLRAHHNAVTLVTVDLGFNTLDVCLHNLDIDLTCVTPKLALLRQQLGQVMRALTSVAGPHVTFIGLGHYNPYLTMSTKEGAAEVFAGNSVVALRQMNRSLSQVYGSFKVRVADVATAFHEEDLRIVRISKKESTTVNVQFECKLTWMCAPTPYGPNIHPSDAGYAAIAKAIAAVLPPKM